MRPPRRFRSREPTPSPGLASNPQPMRRYRRRARPVRRRARPVRDRASRARFRKARRRASPPAQRIRFQTRRDRRPRPQEASRRRPRLSAADPRRPPRPAPGSARLTRGRPAGTGQAHSARTAVQSPVRTTAVGAGRTVQGRPVRTSPRPLVARASPRRQWPALRTTGPQTDHAQGGTGRRAARAQAQATPVRPVAHASPTDARGVRWGAPPSVRARRNRPRTAG